MFGNDIHFIFHMGVVGAHVDFDLMLCVSQDRIGRIDQE